MEVALRRGSLSLVVALLALLAAPMPVRAAGSINIVAAENFYGDVAQQIGGAQVTVRSILSNPDEDPHLFEVTPSVARAVAAARIVIYNGIEYDPWMTNLLRVTSRADREIIVVAELVGRKSGDNPHIWYNPATMRAAAAALAEDLSAVDPAHAVQYRTRLAQFQASLKTVDARIAAIREKWAGTPVAATEPIFGDMFDALGMEVRDRSFQLSVMNNTEPSASDIAGFENDLKTHRVKLLIYNAQTSDPMADRMVRLARAAHIPVVAATETEPPGTDYQAWMLSELDAIAGALGSASP